MGVRNCRDLGTNLRLIVQRLIANDRLVNLLYYTDDNPLEQQYLSEDEKKTKIFNKLIKLVPRIGSKEDAKSMISIRIVRGVTDMKNTEFKNVLISIEVFVPLTQWMIKNENLRPFAILGEIQESLNGKTIEGLGKLTGGDFDLNFLTEEISAYEQTFSLISYD